MIKLCRKKKKNSASFRVHCPKCHSTEVVFKELVPVEAASPGSC